MSTSEISGQVATKNPTCENKRDNYNCSPIEFYRVASLNARHVSGVCPKIVRIVRKQIVLY